MHSIFRELEYFVRFTEFFTTMPRKRVSYEWPRHALGGGFGMTLGAGVLTAITGKVTPILAASVLLLVAACVWSLCCIAWNAWLAMREEVGRE